MTTDVPLSVRTPSPLGEFLRARRHELAPEEVGIKRAKGRRRVGSAAPRSPSSRTSPWPTTTSSSEAATCARATASRRPARALKLNSDGRTHLHALASGTPSRRPRQPEELTEELEELLDSLDPNPAYVVGARWDVLGANHTACQLFTDWESKRSKRERNLLWFYCCDPAARSLFVDWEQEAADQLALFREAYARHPDDPSFKRILDEIFKSNPDDRRVVGASRQRPDAGPHQADQARQRAGDPAAPARAPGARRARHPGHQLLRRRRRGPRRHRVGRLSRGGVPGGQRRRVPKMAAGDLAADDRAGRAEHRLEGASTSTTCSTMLGSSFGGRAGPVRRRGRGTRSAGAGGPVGRRRRLEPLGREHLVGRLAVDGRRVLRAAAARPR